MRFLQFLCTMDKDFDAIDFSDSAATFKHGQKLWCFLCTPLGGSMPLLYQTLWGESGVIRTLLDSPEREKILDIIGKHAQLIHEEVAECDGNILELLKRTHAVHTAYYQALDEIGLVFEEFVEKIRKVEIGIRAKPTKTNRQLEVK
ncbi:hypothetical protein GALMADRAFT_397597 [Galerina marginata CBS 339.88]|uniref:Uncharacterized protein n=1 Tax=Galerina marginata (strain CBS 339.88) TaxID=685588 RepID=A0A067U3K3_GALM3|nr:hypothetical protein GALMADRAFT_397597 [Galerina marginata CBS 339.88]